MLEKPDGYLSEIDELINENDNEENKETWIPSSFTTEGEGNMTKMQKKIFTSIMKPKEK